MDRITCTCFRLLVCVVWAMMLMPAGYAASPPQAHRPHVGPNLVANPRFNGTANWALSGGAQYVTNLSRTADGSGAVRLPPGGRVASRVIAVTPGKSYTFAAYMKTGTWPPGNVDLLFSVTDATGGYIRYGGETGASGNSRPGTWEEIALAITPDASTSFISIVIGRLYPDAGVSDMWVDEIYVGEGTGFGSPPAAKTPFLGAAVQVDALGNFTVKKGDVFQPFFPFCIYSDGRRTDYGLYSTQGFNCDMWGGSSTITRGKNAVSSFNPDGLMSGIGVAQYMAPGGWGWDPGGVNLTNEINAIKATGLMESHVLLWYWDNENIFYEWQNPMTMVGVLKHNDKSPSGERLHPMYILQGSYNAARMYTDTSGVAAADVVGTYADAANTGGAGHAGGLEILHNIQNQTTPVTFAQMNIVWKGIGVGALRGYAYKFIARGARGIGLWRDCFANDCQGFANPVDTVDWWPDVPNLRREFDQMLPLIRQPHWTTWQVVYTAALPLTVGTRDYQGQG
jgi:hypothetical protein